MVEGSKTSDNGDSLLVSLHSPYENVTEIISFSDDVTGESTSCFYDKSFRWGIDGVTYSDWVPLTNEGLNDLMLDPVNPFWIEYRYDHMGDCDLIFESISLEVTTNKGVICKVPQIHSCDGNLRTGSQNLVINQCESSWNPYNVSQAVQAYTQLSKVTSDIFGFCVKYFKTEADQRSKDVILKEYTLFDVMQTGDVKILVPDNELPTREMQFNPFMIDFPVTFEIHVVKSEFQSIFGVNSRPEVKDYLHFPQFMNRMYEVDSVAEADDFFYKGSYWRVSLTPYQQRTAVQYPDKNIEDLKDGLVTSIEEEFNEERNDEFDRVRKPEQYNTIGNLSNDYVRRILDKRLIIKEFDLYNNWNIISKYHYNLSSMTKGLDCVEYQYNGGWDANEMRAFTTWFRPNYKISVGLNVVIDSIVNINNKAKLVATLPTDPRHVISAGDWINISGTSYSGFHKILNVDETGVIIDVEYTDDLISGIPRFKKEFSNQFLVYQNENNETLFSLTHTLNWFIIEINGSYFKYNLNSKNIQLLNGKWYSCVINLNNLSKQLSLFIYENTTTTGSSHKRGVELFNCFNETKTIDAIGLVSGKTWKLLASDMDLTNLRIWKKPIEEENHELILSQYVVKDSHLHLLLDNASPRLLLNRQSNPR